MGDVEVDLSGVRSGSNKEIDALSRKDGNHLLDFLHFFRRHFAIVCNIGNGRHFGNAAQPTYSASIATALTQRTKQPSRNVMSIC